MVVIAPRVFPLLLALVVASGACAPKGPSKVVAMEPRPNPPLSKPPPDNPRDRFRQNPWLAQFWEELTPSQRRRVETRMRRAQPSIARNRESAAMAWDGLGLADRDRLVFGGPPPARPATTAAAAAAAAADADAVAATVGAERGNGAPPSAPR